MAKARKSHVAELRKVYESFRFHPEFLGIDIDSPNARGALGNSLLHLAAFRGDLQACEALIQNGADVNARGDLGNTPLHDAAMGDNDSVIACLLRHGARPDLRNEFHQTPARVADLGGHSAAIQALRCVGG